jgi:S1-C subfamily serine protease
LKYLIILLILLVSCSSLPIKSPPKEVSKQLDETVTLIMTKQDRVHVYCSATWISDNELLSAAHCVRAAAEFEAEQRDESIDEIVDLEGTLISFAQRNEWSDSGKIAGIHFGTAVKVDEDLDLAVIKVRAADTFSHVSAEVGDKLPAIGDSVSNVGHPKGVRFTYIKGIVSNYTKKHIQVNCSSYYGNSGGGLFDSNGKLIGVCVLLTATPQEVLFVRGDIIKEFLDR